MTRTMTSCSLVSRKDMKHDQLQTMFSFELGGLENENEDDMATAPGLEI